MIRPKQTKHLFTVFGDEYNVLTLRSIKYNAHTYRLTRGAGCVLVNLKILKIRVWASGIRNVQSNFDSVILDHK